MTAVGRSAGSRFPVSDHPGSPTPRFSPNPLGRRQGEVQQSLKAHVCRPISQAAVPAAGPGGGHLNAVDRRLGAVNRVVHHRRRSFHRRDETVAAQQRLLRLFDRSAGRRRRSLSRIDRQLHERGSRFDHFDPCFIRGDPGRILFAPGLIFPQPSLHRRQRTLTARHR